MYRLKGKIKSNTDLMRFQWSNNDRDNMCACMHILLFSLMWDKYWQRSMEKQDWVIAERKGNAWKCPPFES